MLACVQGAGAICGEKVETFYSTLLRMNQVIRAKRKGEHAGRRRTIYLKVSYIVYLALALCICIETETRKVSLAK